MPREAPPTIRLPRRPTVVGTGLVALDVVYNVDSDRPPRWYAGGTCCNVLTILSYLRWQAVPVSRLAPGPAVENLLADLAEWKVSSTFVSVEKDGSTPVIIERIARGPDGQPYHTFSWRCPGCGAHLPGYKPILAATAQALVPRLPACQVFFFDRVSRGTLYLAQAGRKRGAVVVFEPSAVGDPKLFREAWSLAHIVKYSHERLRDIADIQLKPTECEGVLLEVETLGPDGLRYRSRLPKVGTAGWRTVPAFRPKNLKDSAGSGDWCSAGLLHRLAHGGLRGLRAADSSQLQEAIRYGQALATWNCGYEGARGGMYQVSRPVFERGVKRILEGSETVSDVVSDESSPAGKLVGCFCPSCKTTGLAPITSNANHAGVQL
jgi:fructokinase